MSQNKTVFPGVGPDTNYSQGSGFAGNNQPYSRSSHQKRGNGTVYPGMENNSSRGSHRSQSSEHPTRQNYGGKPIVGFLYSISRMGSGEYWPLHIGQNIIGNDPDCDIILGEGTVSSKHANLHINKMKKPEKTEATISDLGSTNGTCVNENSVSVARPVECANGDIISIGENYDLLLLLIDTQAIGLHPSENFIDLRTDDENEVMASPDESMRGHLSPTRNLQDLPPRFDPRSSIHEPSRAENPYYGESRPTDSTIGLDPNSASFRSGGTVGMD